MTRTIEFETELTGSRSLSVPPEIASTLPTTGKVTVVVFVDMDPEDAAWRKAAYEQFLADDSEEDASYDRYR
jgi:hypothetical protein